jgi:hypothetical protein
VAQANEARASKARMIDHHSPQRKALAVVSERLVLGRGGGGGEGAALASATRARARARACTCACACVVAPRPPQPPLRLAPRGAACRAPQPAAAPLRKASEQRQGAVARALGLVHGRVRAHREALCKGAGGEESAVGAREGEVEKRGGERA